MILSQSYYEHLRFICTMFATLALHSLVLFVFFVIRRLDTSGKELGVVAHLLSSSHDI